MRTFSLMLRDFFERVLGSNLVNIDIVYLHFSIMLIYNFHEGDRTQ